MNKKGFISMTIIYTFLLLLIFTLLSMLVLYSQKTKTLNSMVQEAKLNAKSVEQSANETFAFDERFVRSALL